MQGSSKDARLGGLRHRLLRGDIDVLSATRVLALVMGDERRHGSLGTGVQIRLGDTHADWGTVVITGQDKRPACRKDMSKATVLPTLPAYCCRRGMLHQRSTWPRT